MENTKSETATKMDFRSVGDYLSSKFDLDKFETSLATYFKDNKFTDNEMHLFSHFLTTRFQFVCTIAKLKADCVRQENTSDE